MRSKIYAYKSTISESQTDIYVFTETNLDSLITSSAIFDDDFSVYRDESDGRLNHKAVGKILIAVRKTLDSALVELPALNDDVEKNFGHLCVKIASRNLLVYSVYVASRASSETYDLILETVQKLKETGSALLLYGDFNLSRIKWSWDSSSQNMTPTKTKSLPEEKLVNSLINKIGLVQKNWVTNCRKTFLDIVFSSNDLNVSVKKCLPLHKLEYDHSPVEVVID